MSVKFDRVIELGASEQPVECVWPGDSDIKFMLRPAVMKEIEKIQKKHSKFKWRKGMKVTDIDDAAATEDLFDYCIVGWEGIEQLDGSPTPCDRAHKLQFVNHSNDLLYWLSEELDKLGDTLERAKEDGLKNSEASSDSQ